MSSSGLGTLLPLLVTTPPGPSASAWTERLARVECPAITARRDQRRAQAIGTDPIVWAEARGANVVDTDGNRYVDLSSGFAVSGVGHAHPRVVEAGKRQLDRLVHAMGDLYPSREKIELGEALAARAPGTLHASILGLSGSDAVEAAIKTALVATGRRRVLAFTASYHGMSLGALGVSGYRDAFRAPVSSFASAHELRLPWPTCGDCPIGHVHPACELACVRSIERMLASDTAGSEDIAAIVVEPIQGRGGVRVPPPGWLRALREVTRRRGILLILDEIYTGLGRTGRWFACEDEGVVPDLLCVGKALGGGVPVSAAIGTPEVMDAWGRTRGEGLHTQTFLGNPFGAAMALETLRVLDEEGLVDRAAHLGERLMRTLREAVGGHPRVRDIRGRGLLIGIELGTPSGEAWAGGGVAAMHAMLTRGIIVAPAGAMGEVVALTPPFVITEEQLDVAVDALTTWIRSLDGDGPVSA